MSELNEDIDKLFKETIEGSGTTPSTDVWSNLEKNLNDIRFEKLQRKQRKLIGVVIFLVLMVGSLSVLEVTNYFQKKNSIKSGLVINKNTKQRQASSIQALTSTLKKPNDENTSSLLIKKIEKGQSEIIKNGTKNKLQPVKSSVDKANLANSLTTISKSIKTAFSNTITPVSETKEIIEHKNKQIDFLRPILAKPIAQNDTSISATTSNQLLIHSDYVRKNNWFISAFFCPEFFSSRYVNNQNEGNYNETENPDFSFTAGIKLTYNLKKRWGISTGLSYSSFSYSIAPKQLYAKQSANGSVNYLLTTTAGVVRFPASNTTQEGDSIGILSNAVQQLQFVSVPVLFQYKMPFRKMEYYVFGGVYSSFLLSGNTEIKFENSEIETSNKIDGLRKMYLTGVVGLGLKYRITPIMSVTLEPTIKKAITSINNGNPVSTYPFSFGLSAGIGFDF